MTHLTQAIFTILSLVNPVICATIFAKIGAGKTNASKMALAVQATVAIAVILCLAALGGAQLLNVFGISLSAFQVAGGMVLVWMGFIMLRGNSSPTSASEPEPPTTESADDSETDDPSDASLTPLILFAASPGTITGVITLSVSHSKSEIPVTALIAIIIALSVTWLIIVLSSRSSGSKKPGLIHDVTTRFMGLIVLAMGVQFALSGLNTFFHPQ